MKLSEVKQGTPIRIEALDGEKRVADIWGKVHKTEKQTSQIAIWYHEGLNINLNAPEYDIKATVFENGAEHDLELYHIHIKETENPEDRLTEKRDHFRIYVSVVVDCIIKDIDTSAMLVDLSEGGFRIAIRGASLGNNMPVVLHVEDEGFDFKLYGKVVWVSQLDEVKAIYGCRITDKQDKEIMMQYIQKKQELLFEELKKEINQSK